MIQAAATPKIWPTRHFMLERFLRDFEAAFPGKLKEIEADGKNTQDI